MAIRLVDVYSLEQVNPGDASYPGGSGKNETTPEEGDGTPFDEIWFNDIQGLLQALLDRAGIVANGNPDTVLNSQYVDAIQAVSLAATQPLVRTPVNVDPTPGEEIGTATPTLIGNEFQSLYGRTHLASEFRVARDAAMTDLVALSGTLGAVEQWLVTPALATGDNYFFDIRYQDQDGIFSSRSVPTEFLLPSLSVQTPTNLLPADLDTSITDVQTFTADAFALIPPGGEAHDASQWQITTDVNFVTIDFDSGEDPINLLSFTQVGLALNLTTYYWRVRYHDANFGWSNFSTAFSFVTVTETVQQPTNLTPTNGQTEISSSVQLTADSFTPIGSAQTHVASQWQAGNSDFSVIYFDSGEDAVNLETINATGYPDGTTTVFWRVRYKGSVTGFSVYSNPFTFVTKAVFADWLLWDGTADGVPFELVNAAAEGGTDDTSVDACSLGGDNVLVAFHADTGSDIQVAAALVTGLSASLIDLDSATSGDLLHVGCEFIDTDKALVIYQVSSTLFGRIATLSGSVITLSAQTTLTTLIGDTTLTPTMVRLDSSRILIAYAVISSTLFNAKVIDVSGATAIAGAEFTKAHSATMKPEGVALLENDKVVMVARETLSPTTSVSVIADISGSTITYGNTATQTMAVSSSASTIVSADIGEFTAFHQTASVIAAVEATYVGNVITYGPTLSAGTISFANKFDALSPIDGQIMILQGDGVISDDASLTPYDPSIPAILTGVIKPAAGLSNGASCGFGVIDESRIAYAYSDGAQTGIMLQIINGEP